MALRWFTPAAIAVVLGSAGAIALAQPQPNDPIAGKYQLTGTQGASVTSVTLTVGSNGAVSRVVTLADGTSQSYSATGTIDGQVLHATFNASAAAAPATSDAPTDAPDLTDLNGTWSVSGRNGFGPYTGSAVFARKGNNWESVFKYTYTDGNGSGSAVVDATLTGSTFAGKRLRTTGLAGTLTGTKRESYPCKYTLSADGTTLKGAYGPGLEYSETFTRAATPTASTSTNASSTGITATYTFDGNGGVDGTLSNPSNTGGWTTAHESGSITKDVRVVSPASGSAVLSGQTLPVVVAPKGATWEVSSGPARKAANGQLQVTGKGSIVLVAKLADKTSDPDTISAVTLEIVEVTVDGSQPISDSAAPHMKRTLGSTDKPTVNPAALLLGDKLKLHVKLAAAGDLAQPVSVKLTASSGSTKLASDGPQSLSALKAGQDVVLTSTSALNDKINVNILALTFTIETDAGTVDAGAPVPLRVYTIFKPTITNGPYFGEQGRPIPTKNHLELACTWASGTSKNVGNGDDSICYKLDNYVRHHVHPIDFKPARMPFTSAYDWNSKTPPLNYKDLDGASDTANTGERPVGQLYYPPLEVKVPAKEDYSHFQSNFGWWVLDNPSNTGGRCNQQASLMCDLFGTFGIQGKIHYLQRVGSGAQTGRPVRQYFNSEKGGEYWNFHGLAEATLADGTTWLYDGSFSWAPDRKNGVTSWAEAPGRWLNESTPFIYEFGPWYYEDAGGIVPTSDIPTTHVTDNPGDGQYTGVPAAKNEDLAWYNKTKH